MIISTDMKFMKFLLIQEDIKKNEIHTSIDLRADIQYNGQMHQTQKQWCTSKLCVAAVMAVGT